MERALQKLASQLNQYDSASLSSLWESYAHQVARFEPTKRWEESVLVFCMIQAVHWKNQLFNSGVIAAQQRAEHNQTNERELKEKLAAHIPTQNKRPAEQGAAKSKNSKVSGSGGEQKQRRKVLVFQPRDSGQV